MYLANLPESRAGNLTVAGKVRHLASMRCPLCGQRRRVCAVIGYDRRFARGEDYTYCRCIGCGLVALDPLPAAQELAQHYPPGYFAHLERSGRNLDKRINRLAVRYYFGVESRARSRLMRVPFRLLSRHVLRGVLTPHGRNRLLDIGCGTGALLDTYQRLGWTVRGIDRSPDAIAAARTRGLSVHHGDVFDAPFGADFDVVLLSHFIEHVRDPIAVLRRAAAFAAAGGLIVILTPNARSLGFRLYGSCWYPLDAPRHLFLFDRDTMHRLAAAAGLGVRRIVTRAEPTFLCYSRHYRRTQGAVLPPGIPARAARLQVAAEGEPPPRVYRTLMTPLASVAARCGWGEVIEARLLPAARVPSG